MIEGRTGAGRDADTAEREVLTELGNPDRLAARYADRRLQLIGPTYYLHWQRLLRLLLTFVPALVGTVVGVVQATTGEDLVPAIASGFGTAFEVAIQVTFWVTLTFAIIERADPSLKLPAWTVDQLPEVPAKQDMTLTDIAASAALMLFTAAFLPWQHFLSWARQIDGERIPLLDPALWRSWLPVLMAVLLAGVVFELVKYRVGRWTWPLVAVKAALDLAFSVPVVWLLAEDRLLNPDLVERFAWLQDEGNLAVDHRHRDRHDGGGPGLGPDRLRRQGPARGLRHPRRPGPARRHRACRAAATSQSGYDGRAVAVDTRSNGIGVPPVHRCSVAVASWRRCPSTTIHPPVTR